MGRRRVEEKKTQLCASVKPVTKEYFVTHDEKAGQVLDDYVTKKIRQDEVQ